MRCSVYTLPMGLIRLCGSQADTHQMAVSYFRILSVEPFSKMYAIPSTLGGVAPATTSLAKNQPDCQRVACGSQLSAHRRQSGVFPPWAWRGRPWATTISYVAAFFIAGGQYFESQVQVPDSDPQRLDAPCGDGCSSVAGIQQRFGGKPADAGGLFTFAPHCGEDGDAFCLRPTRFA